MMDMLNQKQKILVIIGGAFILIIVIFYYISSTKSVYDYNEIKVVNEEQDTKSISKEETEKITIHITGAVKSQGIVKTNENARINDIIELAGGLTEEADISRVNLAYIVEDGQKIYIPFKSDGENTEDDGEIISEEAGEEVLESNDDNSSIININTATVERLESLPGIRKCNSS